MSFEYDRIMIKISLHTKRAVHVNRTILASVVHTSDRIIVVFCAFYSYTWMSLHVQEKKTRLVRSILQTSNRPEILFLKVDSQIINISVIHIHKLDHVDE